MNVNLSGTHALVCGASEGIGRASAMALAELGANVTVLSRREAVLKSLCAQLPKINAGQSHGFLCIDIGNTEELAQKVSALAKHSPVHILVNNTAGPAPGSIASATEAQFLDTFRKHLLANHTLVQAILPGMRDSGYGRVINIISTSVKEPIPNLGVSNTIRGAVASWAKTLSGELGAYGITVNNVLPGFTLTGRLEGIINDRVAATGKSAEEVARAMTATVPLQRFAQAEEIAAAVAFLASPAAAYISGVSLAVDGGRSKSL